ncbi:MAG: threonine synthase [Pseudomonadota bacterium]
MKYSSTRGGADPVDFLTACLAGLAPDGGLYVPEAYPSLEPLSQTASYVDWASYILSAFAGDALDDADVRMLCERAYESFSHAAVTPLNQIAPAHFLLELHHGPTLAFKDVAMQFIGQLYELALERMDRTMTVLCATSGDTGGAAAAAFAGLDRVKLVILHPEGRISPVQRLFMTTTGAPNVHNLALSGSFDDCQSIVKELFADTDLVSTVGLSGVNSINWARIAAQSVYYAYAQAQVGTGRPIRFVVPSGNMGDALAGYVAARCGLLSGFEAVCAVNENQALVDVFETGQMAKGKTVPTPSPAMDITVPSNLERVLFDASGRDSETIRALYASFAQSGDVHLPQSISGPLGCMGLSARPVSNAITLDEVAYQLDEAGELICPHTAVGTSVARSMPNADDVVTVTLATAHAAKFPETVKDATGHDAPLPARCEGALSNREVYETCDADVSAVRRYMLGLQTA